MHSIQVGFWHVHSRWISQQLFICLSPLPDAACPKFRIQRYVSETTSLNPQSYDITADLATKSYAGEPIFDMYAEYFRTAAFLDQPISFAFSGMGVPNCHARHATQREFMPSAIPIIKSMIVPDMRCPG